LAAATNLQELLDAFQRRRELAAIVARSALVSIERIFV
jgi:hypothetical protein